MAIPRWRWRYYADDGCDRYECLNCYDEWESRQGPVREGYPDGWRWCPNCGVQWTGEQAITEEEREDRSRKRGARRKLPDRRPWVLESRTMNIEPSGSRSLVSDWRGVTVYYDRHQILKEYKNRLSIEAREVAEELEDLEAGETAFSWRTEYRIMRYKSPIEPGKQIVPRLT